MKKIFELTKKEGRARRGRLMTVHGTVETPVFQNVATAGAIKGGLTSFDLKDNKCQIALCNTYHLHLRPGDDVVRDAGGIRSFINWDGPVLTDSGGFQVFSLTKLRKIKEEGVYFNSHIDGRKIFMGPKESMRIQSNLGSTIAMAFDECIENPSPYEYVKLSTERTIRWLYRCKEEMERLNALHDTVNREQLLFGINQGGIYKDLRIKNMEETVKAAPDGYAIGGLAVGETAEEMYEVIDAVEPYIPEDRPRYLMGVGTPVNILEAVSRGIDMFDCVMPSRNARHGHLFTSEGIMNIHNEKYKRDLRPIDPVCGCEACTRHSRAYIRHLLVAGEMAGMRLMVIHNLYFYNNLMEEIRTALDQGRFEKYKNEKIPILGKRI